MLGDVNTFRPHKSRAAVAAEARELDARPRTVDASPAQQIASALNKADELLGQLESERNRIAIAAGVLSAATVTPGDLGELQTRADTADTLLAAIDDFVGRVFVVVEKRARDPNRPEQERLDDAVRLHNATARILSACRGSRPVDELFNDAAASAIDALDDAKKLAKGSGDVLKFVVPALALLALVLFLRELKG